MIERNYLYKYLNIGLITEIIKSSFPDLNIDTYSSEKEIFWVDTKKNIHFEYKYNKELKIYINQQLPITIDLYVDLLKPIELENQLLKNVNSITQVMSLSNDCNQA